MKAFESLAEQRIGEALARGELDDLPGAGQPLALDDDSMVPEDLRMAYRVLRNAGVAPPGVALRADLGRLMEETFSATDDAAREQAARRLAVLVARLEASGEISPITLDAYRSQILERLARR